MAFKKNDAELPVEIKADDKVTYTVEVLTVKVISETRVLFSANVNGVKIDGFALVEYTNQKQEVGHLVQYPSRKGSDGKYRNCVWFPISRELRENIYKQVVSLIG